MPRTALTIDLLGTQGLEVDLETLLAAQTIDDVNGSSFEATGDNIIVLIENNNAGAAAVTFADIVSPEGRQLTTAEKTTTIPAGEKRLRGPFKSIFWASKTLGVDKGKILVDSDVPTVNVTLLRVPRL